MLKKIVLLFFFIYLNAYAQDSHYWNLQYGTRSTLLGGAVIGSVSDLSATFYNPGAVALFEVPKFILSAKVYELNNITIENGAGKGKDLDFSSIKPSPNFAAVALKFAFLGENQLILSILTRNRMDFEFETRLIDKFDVFPNQPGDEEFAGGVSINQNFDEVWAGLTYAFKLSPEIGLGITNYFAYRNQEKKSETIIKIIDSNNKISSLTRIENFRYNNLRLLWKAGIGFNFSPLTLGLTVTTSSINILGNGSIGSHFFLTGVDTSGDGIDDNEFESNFQEGISSDYRSSWAIGAGAAYRMKKIKIHISGEWFSKINKYTVLNPESFLTQSSGSIKSSKLTNEMGSVFNYGLGIDYFANEKLILSTGFVTDFSASIPGSSTNLILSKWNLYHVSGGASFKISKSEVTVGLEYSFGSKNIKQIINLSPGSSASEIVGNISDVTVKNSRIKLLFGFIF